jgi:DNA-binding response OmpR family regulator
MADKILVIDDTPVIRSFLIEVLTDAGFEVDTAENGEIGYQMAIKEDYLMIFSDVHMPVMNGFETVQRIRRHKPDVPIIITDSFPDQLAEKATQAGAACCLAKPFALEEVRNIVRNIVESRRNITQPQKATQHDR